MAATGNPPPRDVPVKCYVAMSVAPLALLLFFSGIRVLTGIQIPFAWFARIEVAKFGFGILPLAAGVGLAFAIRWAMRAGLPVERVRLTGWRNQLPAILAFVGLWTLDFGARVLLFGEPGRVYAYFGIPAATGGLSAAVLALAGATLLYTMIFVRLQQRAARPAPPSASAHE